MLQYKKKKNACALQFEILQQNPRGATEKKRGEGGEEEQTGAAAVRTESKVERETEREKRSRMRETEMKTERGGEGEERGRPKACGVHHHFAWLRCD